MVDIDALVAEVTGLPGTNGCWATRLKGDARKFLDALEKVENKDSGLIYRVGAANKFMDKFDVRVMSETVSRHLKRKCLCRPTT